MKNECFEIRFKRDYDLTIYRAMVEIISRSENVIRFSIKTKDKEMQMEKLLFRKNNQWKIIRMNFKMKGNAKVNARLIMEIQDAIDIRMKC